jgi:hypothetical protein
MNKVKKLLPTIFFFAFICALIILVDIKGTEYLLGWFPKIPFSDKLGHFGLYGVLALLLNYALDFRNLQFSKLNWHVGSGIILTFAILEEFTQIFLDTRSFDFLDMAADIAGVWLFSTQRMRNTMSRVQHKFTFAKKQLKSR